jgi:hypothetical protein
MSDGVKIHSEEPDFTIATFENSLLWSFRGEVTAARIRWALPLHRDLAKKYPGGFAVMTVIGENVPLSMEAEARKLSTEITREFQPCYCGTTEVVEGSGFRAATVRSITSGIRFIARASCPAKVFADVGTCSRWLAPLMAAALRGGLEATDLAAAAERVRQGPRGTDTSPLKR